MVIWSNGLRQAIYNSLFLSCKKEKELGASIANKPDLRTLLRSEAELNHKITNTKQRMLQMRGEKKDVREEEKLSERLAKERDKISGKIVDLREYNQIKNRKKRRGKVVYLEKKLGIGPYYRKNLPRHFEREKNWLLRNGYVIKRGRVLRSTLKPLWDTVDQLPVGTHPSLKYGDLRDRRKIKYEVILRIRNEYAAFQTFFEELLDSYGGELRTYIDPNNLCEDALNLIFRMEEHSNIFWRQMREFEGERPDIARKMMAPNLSDEFYKEIRKDFGRDLGEDWNRDIRRGIHMACFLEHSEVAEAIKKAKRYHIDSCVRMANGFFLLPEVK